MISHKPKGRTGNVQVGVVTKSVRILVDVKAEVVREGKHPMVDLKAGEVVVCPIWSARDLVENGKGEWA